MRFFIAVLLVLSCTAYAQIPRSVSFQGVLTDEQGNLVPDGNHQLLLKLFDNAANGNLLFTETQTVPVVNGMFNAIIGSVTPLPASLAFDRAYFLAVNVDGGTELSPRAPLTAAPYALRAATADLAQALTATATGAVRSVNGQAGTLTLQGAGGTTVTNSGGAFTISSTGSGATGIQGVQNTDGTIAVQNPSGPVATIGIPDDAISTQKINSTGAAAGQAIVFNGSNVEWQSVSGGGLQSLQSIDGIIDIQNPTGPVAALAITDGSITSGKIANGSAVRSLNALSDHLTLAASGGATISTVGNTITINAGSGSAGSGIQGVQNTDNTLDIMNPNGPTATINIKDQGITAAKLADNSVNSAKIQDGQVQTSDVADNAIISSKIPVAQVVKSINTLRDDVMLAAGNNVTITPVGNTLSIASTGGATSYWNANGGDIANTNIGNVGIGTTSPMVRLHVKSTGVVSDLQLENTGGTPSSWRIQSDGGLAPNASLIFYSQTASAYRMLINGSGNVGIGTNNPAARLHAVTNGTFVGVKGESVDGEGVYGLSTGGPGVFGFSTTGKGVYGWSPNGTGVLGFSNFGFGVECMGNGCYTGSWTNCSDLRMKKDISPLKDAVSNLLNIRGVYYYWRTDEFPEENFYPTRQIGVIAQEVEPLYPELVVTDSKGYKSVDYTKLTPILLEAIKEQQHMIDEQTKKIISQNLAIQAFHERLLHVEKVVNRRTGQVNLTSMRDAN